MLDNGNQGCGLQAGAACARPVFVPGFGAHHFLCPYMPFSSLGLSPALARAASELGFDQPTPIQSQAIPAIVQGRD
ncbi:MAG: hypothetical protein RSC66_11025, partial [Comamonas sp.]